MLFLSRSLGSNSFKRIKRYLTVSSNYLFLKSHDSPKIPPFLCHLFTNNVNIELLEYPELSSENELLNAISWSNKFKDATLNFNSDCTDSTVITKKLGSEGLLSLNISKIFEGFELNKMQYLQITEDMHFNIPYSLSILMQQYLVTEAFKLSNSENLKWKYLSILGRGDVQGIYCIDESLNNELVPQKFKTHATLSSDGTFYCINGLKTNVLNVDSSKLLLVVANVSRENKSEEQRPATFVIDPYSSGIEFIPRAESIFNLQGIKSYDVSFSDVAVPLENMLIDEHGTPQLTNTLATVENEILSGMHLGILKSIFNTYYHFISNREVFGVPLVSYEQLRFDLINLSKDIYINESLVYFIGGMMDQYPTNNFIMESAATKTSSIEILSIWVNKLIALLGHGGLHKDNKYLIFRDECKYLEYHRLPSVNIRAILGKMVVNYLLNHDYEISDDWLTNRLLVSGISWDVKYTDISGMKQIKITDYIHPRFVLLISRISCALRKINLKLRSLKDSHGNLLLEDPLLHYKLSIIIIDLWVAFINTSRNTRIKCLNLPTVNHQLLLWGYDCKRIDLKINRDISELIDFINSKYGTKENLPESVPRDKDELSVCHPFYI